MRQQRQKQPRVSEYERRFYDLMTSLRFLPWYRRDEKTS